MPAEATSVLLVLSSKLGSRISERERIQDENAVAQARSRHRHAGSLPTQWNYAGDGSLPTACHPHCSDRPSANPVIASGARLADVRHYFLQSYVLHELLDQSYVLHELTESARSFVAESQPHGR